MSINFRGKPKKIFVLGGSKIYLPKIKHIPHMRISVKSLDFAFQFGLC